MGDRNPPESGTPVSVGEVPAGRGSGFEPAHLVTNPGRVRHELGPAGERARARRVGMG